MWTHSPPQFFRGEREPLLREHLVVLAQLLCDYGKEHVARDEDRSALFGQPTRR
jgi:hypothetical protein